MKIVKKVCQYYGAFCLTCKLIDHISPKPARYVREWTEKLDQRSHPMD